MQLIGVLKGVRAVDGALLSKENSNTASVRNDEFKHLLEDEDRLRNYCYSKVTSKKM